MSTETIREPVTLKMIARQLGISPSTVSVVLNGKARQRQIADSTAQLVLDTARKLNYQPNFFATQLKNRSSKLLMLCMTHLHDLQSRVTAGEFVRRATERGYHVMLSALMDDPHPAQVSEAVLGPQGYSGMAVYGQTAKFLGDDRIKQWLDRGVKVTSIGWRIDDDRVNHVMVDEFRGGYIAAAHVYERGAKKVWILGGMQQYPYEDCVRGHLAAAEVFKVPSPTVLWRKHIEAGEWTHSGYEQVKRALEQYGSPDALLGVGGQLVLAGSRALIEAGLRLGEDVMVVSYHTGEIGEYLPVRFTTVDPPILQFSRFAADTLIDVVEGQRLAGESVQFTPALTVRESSTTWKKTTADHSQQTA